MYTQDEINALKKREEELITTIANLKADLVKKIELLKAESVAQIKPLQQELQKVRKPLYARKSYEKIYGPVTPKQPPKTPEKLREYNRIKQREWRAKHKKERLV